MGQSIYLLRHGAIMTDGVKRYIGRTDISLSPVGEKQMRQAGAYLADKALDALFYSPLTRCLQSVEQIVSQLSMQKAALYPVEKFMEIDMGQWEYRAMAEVQEQFPEHYRLRGEQLADFQPPDGESFQQCQERSLEAFLQICHGFHGNLAIIAHAGVNRCLLSWMLKLPLQQLFTIEQPYGAISIIEKQEDKFLLKRLNDFIPDAT